jgi:D-alanine-D-alanine ligase
MRSPEYQIAIVYNLEEQTRHGDPHDLIALQDTKDVTGHLYEAISSLGYRTRLIQVHDSLDELRQDLSSFSNQDTFIFNNCDGFCGNNLAAASVVRTVEEMGFKHTGSCADVIYLCTYKEYAKKALLREGIPTPPFQVFSRLTDEVRVTFPAIVKPVAEDASLGIDLSSVVLSERELLNKVRYVLEEYEQPALVEEFISGRELAVSMFGNEAIEVLPVSEDDYSEINDPMQRLLTYESKWVVESPYYHNIHVQCPALLTREEEDCVVQTAREAYRAVGLRDFGRMDIRFDNGIAYIIDINELPDLNPESGFPHTALVGGYAYPEMVEHILDLALRREGWRE